MARSERNQRMLPINGRINLSLHPLPGGGGRRRIVIPLRFPKEEEKGEAEGGSEALAGCSCCPALGMPPP